MNIIDYLFGFMLGVATTFFVGDIWKMILEHIKESGHAAPKAPPPTFRRVQPGELVILEESRIRGRLIRKPEFPPPREIPGDVP